MRSNVSFKLFNFNFLAGKKRLEVGKKGRYLYIGSENSGLCVFKKMNSKSGFKLHSNSEGKNPNNPEHNLTK